MSREIGYQYIEIHSFSRARTCRSDAAVSCLIAFRWSMRPAIVYVSILLLSLIYAITFGKRPTDTGSLTSDRYCSSVSNTIL